MAYGGRWLYREIVRLGFDPADVVVTDLDSDYRVHPAVLRLPDLHVPDRPGPLPPAVPAGSDVPQQPVGRRRSPIRLVAVGATHVQMWRSLTPSKLVSFSSYAVSLQTVHEVDYWATDAIPEDSRFYWKSFFRYSGDFRAVPLFIPMYGDAVRARSYPRTLVQQYTQIRRWAWGVTDIPYYIQNAFAHREIPRRLRIRRLIDLWMDHINWAIAPFVHHLRLEPAAAAQPDVRPDDARSEPAAVRGLAADRRVLLPADPGLRRGADRAAAAGARGGSPERAVVVSPVAGAAGRRARLQQPPGARRPDAADGRQVPRVPGDREGLTGDRRRRSVRDPGGAVRFGVCVPVVTMMSTSTDRRVGHERRLHVEHVLEQGDRRGQLAPRAPL